MIHQWIVGHHFPSLSVQWQTPRKRAWELIGSLLWVANGTRPDISFAVGSLAKYTSNPGRVHWEALLRILGYLSQTLNHCIRYKRDTSHEGGSCPNCQIFSAMSMRVLQVMLTLGGALLVTYSRSVEDQYHGRVRCNPLWHYPVWSLSTWRQVRLRRKPCGWTGYYSSFDSRLPIQLHYMKTTRLLYSLQIIPEITGDLNTLIHGVTLWEKLWPIGR